MIELRSTQGLEDYYELIVIGAGPAGMSAAIEATRAGVKTLVLDENARVGGQIYRAITSTSPKRLSILGKDYEKGRELALRFMASNVAYLAKATVWRLTAEHEVGVSHGNVSRLIVGKRILVATGAMERPFPIPGWTLPGVMTAGAAQILLKASGATLGPKVVLAGTGPLLWLIASQYAKANVPLAAILDTAPRSNFLAALPRLPSFLSSRYLVKGFGLMAKVRRTVQIYKNVEEVRAEGDGRIERVCFVASGKERRLPVDHLLLHQGVVPEISLLRSAGCEMLWDDEQICWRPVVNSEGETSVSDIYVAGDGRAIYGAETARFGGRKVGLEIAKSLGKIEESEFLERRARIERQMLPFSRGRAFLDRLFMPRRSHLVPADEALACRCEEVTGAAVRHVATQLKVQGPNQLKAFLRCGMGPCQGRQCALGITQAIAEIRGVSPAVVGGYRLRPPVKPITVGQIADLQTAVESHAE